MTLTCVALQPLFDRAIAEFDKAIEINPSLADAWCNRGFAHYYKGDLERAIAE